MKKLAIYAGILLSILFLWLALRHTNFTEIVEAFAGAKLWPLFPMLVCLFAFYWLKALRWSVLLSRSHDVSGLDLVPAMMAGAAGNNLLPAHFGEFVRLYFAGNKFQIPKTTVLATLMAERTLDVIAVLLIFSVAVVQHDFSGAVLRAAHFLILIASIAIVFIALLIFRTETCISFFEKRLRFLEPGLRSKILAQLSNMTRGLSAIKSGPLFFNVAANSLLQWLLMVGCIYFALTAFNIASAWLVAMLILGILVAGLALPTSPGFFGTMEYCFVLGLATAGVDASTALSAAIYYHVPAWITVTLTGLVLLRANRMSLNSLRSGSGQ